MLILFVKKIGSFNNYWFRLNFLILIIVLIKLILKFIPSKRSVVSAFDSLKKHGIMGTMWIITEQGSFFSRVYTGGEDRDCP